MPVSSPARRPRRRWLWWTLGLTVGLPLAAVAGLWLYTLTLRADVPDLHTLRNPDLSFSSVAYTADGVEIARYHAENRTWVGFDAISPAVVGALVATEDARFYDHGGVDLRRLASSTFKTLRGDTQGGSTITMQLARNLFPGVGKEKSVDRKLREIITARRLERLYSKEDILEMYLNTVAFNYNAFGIEAAAHVYFDTTAKALAPEQAAVLVGMLQAPTAHNPVDHPEAARRRRNVVLALMATRGFLQPQQAASLQQQDLGLHFSPPAPEDSPAPHFAAFVKTWVEAWCRENGYSLERDGLRIYTTLDSKIQAMAVRAVEKQADALQAVADYEWSRASPGSLGGFDAYVRAREAGRFEPFAYFWHTQKSAVDAYVRQTARYRDRVAAGADANNTLAVLRADAPFMDSLKTVRSRLDAGLVALDPQTGFVRAWVGGRDFSLDSFDKVAQARRQPGSTFKPFVYAAAIDWGYSPDDPVEDRVQTYGTADGAWRPTNAGGGASGDTLTLRDALAFSKNTVSARLISEVGPGYVARIAHKMGIVSPLREVPSLALGTSEVTLLEMAGAYATLANNGTRRLPVVVTRIENRDGTVLAQFSPPEQYGLSGTTAYTVLDMMRGVVDRGTGRAIRSQYGIRGDLAGKTGTTQHNADGWFMLVHPQLVTGAWVGFSDRRVAFRSSYWGQGAHNALHVVGAFFEALQSSDVGLRDDLTFAPPPGYAPPGLREDPWWETDSLYASPYDDVYADSTGWRYDEADAEPVEVAAPRPPVEEMEALPAAPARPASRPEAAPPSTLPPATGKKGGS